MRIDFIRRKALRGLLVIAFMTAGTTAVVASPAMAIGGCSGGYPISACVDGPHGSNARADFYMNGSLGNDVYRYEVYIFVNDKRYTPSGNGGRLNYQGRYCCWYAPADSDPNSMKKVQTRVYVYRYDNSLNYIAHSPIINYIN